MHRSRYFFMFVAGVIFVSASSCDDGPDADCQAEAVLSQDYTRAVSELICRNGGYHNGRNCVTVLTECRANQLESRQSFDSVKDSCEDSSGGLFAACGAESVERAKACQKEWNGTVEAFASTITCEQFPKSYPSVPAACRELAGTCPDFVSQLKSNLESRLQGSGLTKPAGW